MEEWDIQYKELLSMPEQSYRLIDIRDEASMSYGMIPGAGRAAELCVRCVRYPCYDPRRSRHQGTAQSVAVRRCKARAGEGRKEAGGFRIPAQKVPDLLCLPDGSYPAVRRGVRCASGYRVYRRCYDHPVLRGRL